MGTVCPLKFPVCLHWCEDLEEEEGKDQDKEDVSLNLDADLEEQTIPHVLALV